MNSTKIIHVDMDAFFASVEQRDNSELRGRPIVVGGSPEGRGVVAAASYEARAFGIRSAMPAVEAKRRCRDLIFVRPRIQIYRRISNSIFGILRNYTDLIEPLSLDEAYLDVTRNKRKLRFASQVAREIRRQIFELTGLTASCGVANSKFLAKIASDLNKPNGMAVILPSQVEAFLKDLPVRKLPGIGPKTEDWLLKLGFQKVGDFQKYSLEELRRFFGRHADYYFNISRGIDLRPVQTFHERKSLGAEHTFTKDTSDTRTLHQTLEVYVERIEKALQKKKLRARTITLKIRYANFETVTRSRSLKEATDKGSTLIGIARGLLALSEYQRRPLRLLGLSVGNLEATEDSAQLSLNL